MPSRSRSAACSRWVAVWLRIVASRVASVDHRAHALPGAELALDRLERERLVVAEPVHVDHPRAARWCLDDAGVRDLAATLRVEGALLELGEQPAVRALGHAQDGVRLGRLVADEARPEVRLAGEALDVLMLQVHVAAVAGRRVGAGRARDLARLLHELLEALVVDRQPLIRQELLGHLVGEAVGVVQAEGVLRRHPGGLLLLGALDQLGQQPLALRERAPEALLLRARPALDRRATRAGAGDRRRPSPRPRARRAPAGTSPRCRARAPGASCGA